MKLVNCSTSKWTRRSVLKKAEVGGYPNAADTLRTYKTVKNDFGSVIKELNSLGYCVSFPDIDGSSPTTSSGNLLVVAVTPPLAAVSHTTTSPTPPTPSLVVVSYTTNSESVTKDTTTLEVDVEMANANAVHKEARGKMRCISLKALKSKSSDIRPFKKHKKN
ncbi:unnamed protein product [Prunus armeniaca]|uniref:Uncharacterized protein n=1 Tax=Prunus armeniaca TaxID=36596 RepID=A0A6J5V0Q6_PRUAR|nr:hypothetical protein GBA52_021164 [Prunus armeniaca]CAB4282509.1 unnamed protein product [Prunus armeniaca]CAB4312921.1 unnamed protein product [Prunus armeniaca]